jgi:hypothetical protein
MYININNGFWDLLRKLLRKFWQCSSLVASANSEYDLKSADCQKTGGALVSRVLLALHTGADLIKDRRGGEAEGHKSVKIDLQCAPTSSGTASPSTIGAASASCRLQLGFSSDNLTVGVPNELPMKSAEDLYRELVANLREEQSFDFGSEQHIDIESYIRYECCEQNNLT